MTNSQYTFIGIQKGIDELPDVVLMNCSYCGSTITPRHQEEHLKEKHINEYYQLNQTRKKVIAQRFLNYVVGV